MPLIRFTAPDHLTDALVQQLAQVVQHALVTTCNVPVDDRFILLNRVPAGHWMADPYFGGVMRSRNACLAEILLLQGRTADQKRRLFREAARGVGEVGFRPDDLMLALTENTAMDWSLGGGMAYADVSRS